MLIDRLLDTGANRATTFTTASGGVHDRTKTIGASENYSCIRRLWFAKNAPEAENADHRPAWGFFQRGHTVEDWLVGLIRESLPDGWQLLYVGADQTTLVDGVISATPDGLLITDEGEEVAVEIKSLDPRSNLDSPKLAHVHQMQVQMGLFSELTDHRPVRGVLYYVNSSDYSNIVEHHVEFDPGTYSEARERAERVYNTKRPHLLPAEGAWDDTCRLCPFTNACGEAVMSALPTGDNTPLEPEDLDVIKALVMDRHDADVEIKALTTDKKRAEEQLKVELRRLGLNKIRGEGWDIGYTKVAGRSSLDKDALTEAGINLDHFMRKGRDSERLTIKVK